VVYFGTLFLSAGRGTLSLLIYALGLATTAALTPPLIAAMGYSGAAAAIVISTWTVQLLATVLLLRRVFRVRSAELFPLWALGQRALGALVAGVVLIPAVAWSSGHPLARLAIFGSLYAIAVFLYYRRAGWVDPAAMLASARGLFARSLGDGGPNFPPTGRVE
jgi:O-antigen/teichoic acid export membrane protein